MRANAKRYPNKPWTDEEDACLISLVEKYGKKQWSKIGIEMESKGFPKRLSSHYRYRWNNHLDPSISNDEWSKKETDMLISLHTELGNKWSEISKRLDGRYVCKGRDDWVEVQRL